MDSTEQVTCASALNTKHAARVIRDVVAIERDYLFAFGPVSEALMREAAATIRKAAPEAWEVEGTEWGVSVLVPEWMPKPRSGSGDAWFELEDIVQDDEAHSWVAVAVSAGPAHMCLELKFRKGLTAYVAHLDEKAEPLARLINQGFVRDDARHRIYLPIKIDREALAKGFELNDFDKALAPIKQAIDITVNGKAELDALIESVRVRARAN